MTVSSAITMFVPARVVVDPNSISREDPSVSLVRLSDAARPLEVGEMIWAVQPDDDGFEGIAPAHVVAVDRAADILKVRVDWESFAVVRALGEVPPGSSGGAGAGAGVVLRSVRRSDGSELAGTGTAVGPARSLAIPTVA